MAHACSPVTRRLPPAPGRRPLGRPIGGPSRIAAFGVLLVGLLSPLTVTAQLISPGKLSTPHTELEGVRNCTRCHELRTPGVSADLCLACHEPLADRIRDESGFHASLPELRACASCHKEHFGVDFGLIVLDTTDFDHGRVGYELQGGHTEPSCRECHTPALISDAKVRSSKEEHGALDRTFLGLPTECASCHDADSPHESQFAGRACTECHDVEGWEGALEFDHDRARYRLTGRHRDVECTQCHAAAPRPERPVEYVRYTPVAAGACDDCHEDVHEGAMQGTCASCHETSDWDAVDRERVESTFDHATTGFALDGRHALAPCASCHDARAAGELLGVSIRFQAGTEERAFPQPEIGSCLACHVDRHDGVFEAADQGGDCDGCHGQEAWLPSMYDWARHNRETPFTLEGAHVAVSCDACHVPTEEVPTFRIEASTCTACHQATDPHADQFAGRECDECHSVASFLIPDFDHDRTGYPLDGSHVGAPCASCHQAESDGLGTPITRYRPLGTECRDCHGGTA